MVEGNSNSGRYRLSNQVNDGLHLVSLREVYCVSEQELRRRGYHRSIQHVENEFDVFFGLAIAIGEADDIAIRDFPR